MSSRVIVLGVTVGLLPDGVGDGSPGLTADGAKGAVPSKKSGCDDEPVCQSCTKMTPPSLCTASVTADQARTWASVKIPGTSCQPTASRLIHVPSVTINPAEARWAPFYGNMPVCDDSGVLSTISGRFGQTQREFWNSQLAIDGFDRVREIGFRSNGLAYIPRRFCVARATMSDREERTVVYNVTSQFGIIGVTWGVEWCVHGLDPNHAFGPDCEAIRPILEREIGEYKWLGEYGLKARY